ncbi:MAG: PQQ-dependent sugar dehydrogenase, partial [Bacteroidota bacterium]
MKKSLSVYQLCSLFSILTIRGICQYTLLIGCLLGFSRLAYSQVIPAPDSIDPYLNGIFPDQTPGPSGSWEVVNAFPNLTFVDPVSILEVPGTTELLIAGKSGKLWTIENDSNTSVKTIFLDIESQIYVADDCGLLGVVFHPEFGQAGSPNRGYFYVYYRYTTGQVDGEKAYLRLSRFTLADSASTVDPSTEYVLIQQYDRHRWHNGGGMFFAPDGFLYLSIGDEGSSNDFFNTTQAIDQWLFSGVMRIDVDKDSTRSHPIRRQPQNSADPPTGWPGSFTQGYYIPNDNPWLDSTGAILEEFYALGLRSPHRMTRDPQTGDIWVGDIGQSLIEEVSKIAKGDNLQWPYKEGHGPGPKAQPNPLIGNDRDPVYSYNRTEGTSVIGGFVYRGTKFPTLFGKYIFGDHTFRSVWTLEEDAQGGEPVKESLVTVPAEGVGTKNGISSFGTDSNGEVLILKLFGTDMDGGKVFKLQKTSITPDPPALLSQTGAFTDLNSLTPSQGIFPYKPNARLWTDGALKQQWIAIPNDGIFDEASEKVTFNAENEWIFPSGTVIIKHFELPVDEANPSITKRLETRFFVITADGRGYGVTYQWNDQGTEATLLTDGDSKDFTIARAGGGTYTQTWNYPSRQQCMTCHNEAATYVLGVKTHHLNGDFYYPSGGTTANQLDTWNAWGIFDSDIGNHSQYLKSVDIEDSTASLESRVRSYLDINCAYCHRPNYVQGAFDARFTTQLTNQNLINASNISASSTPGGVIINPGDPHTSELWIRDGSSDGNRMPPLGVTIVDTTYIQVLTEWINSLGNQDTIPPTVPTGLVVSDSTGNTLQVTWDASTDNVGVSGYKIHVDKGTQVIIYEVPYSPFGNVIDLYGLEQGASFIITISALDEAGNESYESDSLFAFTRSCGITVSNIVLSPVTACGLNDGSISIQAQGNSLEYSIDGGITYSSSSLFENLEGGSYWVFVRESGDTTSCTISDQVFILEPDQCPTCDPLQNIALGQATSQSSTYGNGVSGVAVDGVQSGTSPWGNDPTLQHTQTETEPWWKLSLDTLYQLENVKILNRSDCCQDRLRDFYVFVSDGDIDATQSLDSLLADSTLYSVYYSGPAGLEETLSLNHQHGSTLLIKMTGTGLIHLAEVEVYGCPLPELPPCNLSFSSLATTPPTSCTEEDGFLFIQANGNDLLYSIDGGLTYQSSPTYDSLASGYYYLKVREANQGGCELEYPNNPVSIIASSAVGITEVSSTLQTDCDNPNGTIAITAYGNNLEYSIDGGNQFQDSSTFYNLSGGNYFIQIRNSLDSNCVASDTVQVASSSACDSIDCSSNLALGKSVSQSSQYGDGVPEIAVDGDTSGTNVWGQDADLQHTQTESQPWWKVNLGSVNPLDSMRIYNRSNCCQSRLNNFYILVASSDFDANLAIDTLLADTSITAFHFPGSAGLIETISLGHINGQFAAIKLTASSVQLHMAEVEVYGCNITGQCVASIDSLIAMTPSSCGLSDGEIAVNATGDSLEYSIDGGVNYQDTATFSGLGSGLYTVFVREKLDTTCVVTDTIRITLPTVPVISSVLGTNPTDCGISDGTLTILASGDSLEYSIDGGLSYQDSNYFSGLAGDSYNIYVREKLNPSCEAVDSTNLINPSVPIISSVLGTDPTDCGVADGTLTILASGNSLEYSIDGGLSYQDSNYFSGLAGDSYNIYVREILSMGCVAIDTTILTEPSCQSDSCTTPTNLALGKPTSQMGQYGEGASDIAVDGDTTGTTPWGAGADLQHASTGTEPWWKVDLEAEAIVDHIKIYNRSSCCQDRLEDFYVFISSQDIDASQSISTLLGDANVQSVHNTNTLGLTEIISLNQAQGRYIVVKLVGNNRTLHLSEVEVHGCIDSSVPPT